MSLLGDGLKHGWADWVRWAIGGIMVGMVSAAGAVYSGAYSVGAFKQSIDDRFNELKAHVTAVHDQEERDRNAAIGALRDKTDADSQRTNARLDKIENGAADLRSTVDRLGEDVHNLVDAVRDQADDVRAVRNIVAPKRAAHQ